MKDTILQLLFQTKLSLIFICMSISKRKQSDHAGIDAISTSKLYSSMIAFVLTTARRTNEPRHEKTNVLVSDMVRHKPGCTVKEDG